MAFEKLRGEPSTVENLERTENGWFRCTLKLGGHNFTVVANNPEAPLIITSGSTMNGLPTEDDLHPEAVRKVRKAFSGLTEQA